MRRGAAAVITLILAGCAAGGGAPLDDDALTAALAHRKIEVRAADGSKRYLRTYADKAASFASPSQAWSAPWRISGGALCIEGPAADCYVLRALRPNVYSATPADGGESAEWFVMKRLDVEGNNYE